MTRPVPRPPAPLRHLIQCGAYPPPGSPDPGGAGRAGRPGGGAKESNSPGAGKADRGAPGAAPLPRVQHSAIYISNYRALALLPARRGSAPAPPPPHPTAAKSPSLLPGRPHRYNYCYRYTRLSSDAPVQVTPGPPFRPVPPNRGRSGMTKEAWQPKAAGHRMQSNLLKRD